MEKAAEEREEEEAEAGEAGIDGADTFLQAEIDMAANKGKLNDVRYVLDIDSRPIISFSYEV